MAAMTATPTQRHCGVHDQGFAPPERQRMGGRSPRRAGTNNKYSAVTTRLLCPTQPGTQDGLRHFTLTPKAGGLAYDEPRITQSTTHFAIYTPGRSCGAGPAQTHQLSEQCSGPHFGVFLGCKTIQKESVNGCLRLARHLFDTTEEQSK